MNGVPFSMLFGGYLERKIGARKSIFIGSLIYTSAICISYFTVQTSYLLLLLTLGIIGSLGHGMGYNCVLIHVQRWLPEHVGLASGLAAAGFGSSAFIVSPVQTKFINPDNYQVNEQGYFTQVDLLERVPRLFLLLTVIFGICQLIGLLFIGDPKSSTKDPITSNGIEAATPNQPHNLSIKEVINSCTFRLIFITFFLNIAWGQISCGLFKAYGMQFIHDDFFLAVVASLAAASNCISRIIWGIIMDKTSYRTSMLSACALGTFLMWTLPTVKAFGSKELFLVWVCLMFSIVGGTFALVPSVIHKCFGAKNFGLAYGFAQVSMVCFCLGFGGRSL
uniref:Oxalate:formate antiporter n=1 Tax=Panagrolaimus davidi TaxID=227884 RepID=A0A914PC82_9BILA